MTLNNKDILAGVVFALCGAFFIAEAVLTLDVGSALEMGPGYFPLIIGILLLVLGAAILRVGIRKQAEKAEKLEALNWRSIILIALAPVLFGVLIQRTGLIPATAAAILAASFASSRMTVRLALGLTVGLTVGCVIVFRYWLGLNLPLIAGVWS